MKKSMSFRNLALLLMAGLMALGLTAAGCGDDGIAIPDGGDGADDAGDTAPDSDDAGDAASDTPEDPGANDQSDDSDLADALPDAGSDADEPDAGPVNPFPTIAKTEPEPGYDPDGAEDLLAALEAGEVRAGRIREGETGFAGQDTDCRVGDFRIYNAVAQFCIAGEVSITAMMYSGGHLIDADFIGGENDRFFLLGSQNHMNLGGATSVEVLADGSDGQAVIRVEGPEQPIKLLDDYLGRLFRLRGVSFITEYRLSPDVPWLEIVTWVRADGADRGLQAGDMLHFGDTAQVFRPGFGRAAAGEEPFPWLAATAEGRSYGLYRPEGFTEYLPALGDLLDFPLTLTVNASGQLPANLEAAFRRYFILGDGGTDSIRAAIAQLEGTELPAQGARFSVALGETGRAGLRLLVGNASGAVDVVVTDEAGEAYAPLPPGEYTVAVENWTGVAPGPVTFTVAAGEDVDVAVALPSVALVSFTILAREDVGADAYPSPAKVELVGAGRSYQFFYFPGHRESLEVVPGTYSVTVSRGEEYSALRLDSAVLSASTPFSITTTLTRLWDTDGLISGEFHQHSTRSFDSTVIEEDRLLANLVEGVDFVVPSDHEAVTDLSPWVDLLDASDLIFTMPGVEISPPYAHFNPMPMVFDAGLPGGGTVPFGVLQENGTVYQRRFPEMVAELRENFDIEVIQVNHPRGGSSLFDSAGYDPLEGPEGTSSTTFTTDFDSVEVFNDRDVFCQILTDWLSLIARGHRITGVGNSDSHSLGDESGYPRNYLPSDAASPAEITQDDIIDGILSGNVSVSGGALITFPGGPTLGAELDASEIESGSNLPLPILVQTPSWSTVHHLLVVVNGRVVVERSIDEDPETIVVFDEVVEVPLPDEDAYLMVLVWGETAMPYVNQGAHPFGFTNPIYLDRDGDGEWTPPGVAGEEDLLRVDMPGCD